MTVIRPNSVSGITSITAQANEINFFRSNGTLAGLQLNGVNFNTTTGVSTFNNLDVGGVLTYQDVTNVDSVGIITARSTIDAQGSINLADSIIHTGDTDTKISFTNNQIDLQCAGSSRAYINDYGLYIASGFPLAFLASSGATPNIKSGGTNAQDLLFTTGSGNPTRMQIKSDGKVGINASSPDCMLHVVKNSAGTMSADGNAVLALENNNHCVLNMMSPADKSSYIMMGDPDDINAGQIRYDNNINALLIHVNGDERLHITSNGDTEIRNIVSGITNSYSQYLKFRTTQTNGQSAVTGQIAAQGKSSWGGDLVFYTKPANATPNDTVSERLRITSGGQVNVAGNMQFTVANPEIELNNGGPRFRVPSANTLTIHNGGTLGSTNNEVLRIASNGNVGISKDPLYMLDIEKPNSGGSSKQLIQRWMQGGQNTLELHMYGGNIDQTQFAAVNGEQTLSFLTGVDSGNVDSTETTLLMTQNRDLFVQGPDTGNYGGGLFIGRSASPYGNLCALRDSNRRPIIYLAGRYPEITLAHEVPSNTNHAAGIRFATYIQSTNTATGNQFVIGTNGPGTYLDIGHSGAGQNKNVHAGISNHSGTTRFRVTTSGCEVYGTFSVSSTKNFKISHPLSTKTETHDLVHSSIEGPQADLIYRGVVDLVDGTATVNVDTAARMTEGTFVALCTNVSCFTSNETDWTAVKGSVSGNILTITAQDNTSTATVSWMVVGERKDQGMIDSPATDDNGRLITEPLKSS